MVRGAWQLTVHGVETNQTQLSHRARTSREAVLSFHEIHERRKPECGVMHVCGEVEQDAPN